VRGGGGRGALEGSSTKIRTKNFRKIYLSEREGEFFDIRKGASLRGGRGKSNVRRISIQGYSTEALREKSMTSERGDLGEGRSQKRPGILFRNALPSVSAFRKKELGGLLWEKMGVKGSPSGYLYRGRLKDGRGGGHGASGKSGWCSSLLILNIVLDFSNGRRKSGND